MIGDRSLSQETPPGLRCVLPIEDVRFRRIGLARDRIAHLVPQAEKHRVVGDEARRLTCQAESHAVFSFFNPLHHLGQRLLASPLSPGRATHRVDGEECQQSNGGDDGDCKTRPSQHAPQRAGFRVDDALPKGIELPVKLYGAREAIVGVLLESLAHDPLQLAGDTGHGGLERGRVIAQNRGEHFRLGLPRKRGNTREHLVEHAAEREAVTGWSGRNTFGLLR